MKILRRVFWSLFFTITGTNKLYNRFVYQPIKRKIKIDSEKEFQKIFRYAISFNNFYKKKYYKIVNKKISLENIQVLDKKELKSASLDILSNKYKKNIEQFKFKLNSSILRNLIKLFIKSDFIITMSTGGSTGIPLICYKNKQSIFTDTLLFIRGWTMMGYKPGDKVLVFYNSYYDYDFSNFNKGTLLHGIKLFFFNVLSKTIIKNLVNEINNFKPDFIITFPSYLNEAANIIREENLILKYTPKSIEVSGEVYSDHQRKNCEETFKTEIYDSYGSIEFGMIAHECKYHNGMHIYEDIAKVESLKIAENKKVLIVTRYNSFETPIIRYKIGDLGNVYYDKCECGIEGLKLNNVEGRTDDYILLPNKKRLYPSYFRQILNHCNEFYNNTIIESNIINYVIKGYSYKLIINILIKDVKYRNVIKDVLSKYFNKTIPRSIILKIKFPDRIKKKRKFSLIEKIIVN